MRKNNYNKKYYSEWVEIIHRYGYDTCSKCGYNKCLDVIEWHHPTEIKISVKEKISKSKLYSYKPNEDLMKKVVKQTVPLCANCHREAHFEEKQEDYEKGLPWRRKGERKCSLNRKIVFYPNGYDYYEDV